MSSKGVTFKNKANVRTFNNNTSASANSQANLANKATKSSKTRRSIRTIPSEKMYNYLNRGRNNIIKWYKDQKGILKNFHKFGIIPNNTTYRHRRKELNKNFNKELDRYAASVIGASNTPAAAATGGGSAAPLRT